MYNFKCSPNDLEKILAITKKLCGNDLSSKKDILKNKISHFANQQGIDNAEILISRLSYNNPTRQEFINLVTINETYFYREIKQLNAVVDYVNLLNYPVRILCAPCSSGEETYSLGMLCRNIGIDKSKVKLVGIDINSEVISMCESGIYTARSIKNVNEKQKSIYFESVDDKFKIKKELLPSVEFKIVNIFDDALLALGKFDIILCRNMMIYFDEEYRNLAMTRFYQILKPYGRIYFGSADFVPYTDIFRKVCDINATYYERM